MVLTLVEGRHTTNWFIDFQQMVQVDQQTHQQRKIRRSDMSVHADHSMALPPDWGNILPGQMTKEAVLPNSPNYNRVIGEFKKTSPNFTIISVWQVRNASLWQAFQVHKRMMKEKLGRDTERWLWHGAAESAIESINKEGFNRSYSGRNATAFGDGVYFAVNSNYSASNTYSTPNANGVKQMYYARVLVGDSTLGNGTMRVLPQKAPPAPEKFDSATDNLKTPQMFVIFSDTQAYPEFLIEFK
jgi:poly [ADP-ribose] polymerase 10/14/15